MDDDRGPSHINEEIEAGFEDKTSMSHYKLDNSQSSIDPLLQNTITGTSPAKF